MAFPAPTVVYVSAALENEDLCLEVTFLWSPKVISCVLSQNEYINILIVFTKFNYYYLIGHSV